MNTLLDYSEHLGASAGKHRRCSYDSALSASVIYKIWLRSFTAEGTIRAASERLPEVADLGVSWLLVSPFLKPSPDTTSSPGSKAAESTQSHTAPNPYGIADFEAVDPEFGTWGDWRRFVDTAHRLGMKAMMEVVFTHSGTRCGLLEYPGFYRLDDRGNPLLGECGFPLFDFKSDKLRAYLIARLCQWVSDDHVDGFSCVRSSEVPVDFWKKARVTLEERNPQVVMLGDGTPEEMNGVFDLGYDKCYYSSILSAVTDGQPAIVVHRAWEDVQAGMPEGSLMVRSNEDVGTERADLALGEGGAEATDVLACLLDGVPLFMNGQEIGDATPINVTSAQTIRWDSGSFVASNFRARPRRKLFRQLLELRKENACLNRGEVVWLDNDQQESVLSFVRQHDGRKMLVVINLSNRSLQVSLDTSLKPFNRLFDLVRGCPRSSVLGYGRPTFMLEAYAYIVGEPMSQRACI
ncbi:MAG: alpha-amylase family glycosyl hydrolase [Verrucomicrobiota bacterium JB024]|nr:alpha-amylase family glycosyl hydrolase [Verrucomicrobiota bacterium JB024]